MVDTNGNCEYYCNHYSNRLSACLYFHLTGFDKDAERINLGQPCLHPDYSKVQEVKNQKP